MKSRRKVKRTNGKRTGLSYATVPRKTLKMLEEIFNDIAKAAKRIPGAKKEFIRTSYVI